jgi:hypothetical protein
MMFPSPAQKARLNFSHIGQIPSGPELAGFSETQLIVASDNAPSIAGILKRVVTNAIHRAKILEAGGSHDRQEAAEVIDVLHAANLLGSILPWVPLFSDR